MKTGGAPPVPPRWPRHRPPAVPLLPGSDPPGDPPGEAEPRWGLGDALAGFSVGLVLSVTIGNLWLSAHPAQKDLSLGGQGLAQVGLWAGLSGSAVWATRRKGSGSLRRDFGFWGRPKDVITGIVVGVVTHEWVVGLVRILLRPVFGHPHLSGPTENLVRSAKGVGLAVLIVFLAVGAPVVEELFFRGLVLRSLERRFGPGLAIVGSSVLFGAAHIQPMPGKALAIVMISLAVFGAILAGLAVKIGRLGPGMVAHAVFNGWTIFFLLHH